MVTGCSACTQSTQLSKLSDARLLLSLFVPCGDV